MNILLDKLDFNESWAYETLKNIIKPEHKICMFPFAFGEDLIKNKEDLEKYFNKENGEYYKLAVSPFYAYGISDENITMVDYFSDNTDIAKEKINSSHIIFFTGGFPDKMMNRLAEFHLINFIEQYEGIIMGWSAGAMVQCLDYYVSPDKGYPEFAYRKGLNFIKDFAVEVHYKNTAASKESIEKYMMEKGKKVYTTESKSGLIVDGDKVTLLGNAKVYTK